MKDTSLKQKLKNKELTVGSWITIGHPAIAEILATANFDWLVIDTEHTTIDLSMVQTLITAIQSKGIAALVR
jgi:2-dehydro-3-deoxyglucarate aldolase